MEGDEKAFAEEQGAHPGYLGLVCPADYKKMCDHDPTLPWTDPISGETNYRDMQEDLGVSGGGDLEYGEWGDEQY